MHPLHVDLAAALAPATFRPFAVETRDGRRIPVRRPGDAVLNPLALSVCEAPFSVTVLGLDQIERLSPLPD